MPRQVAKKKAEGIPEIKIYLTPKQKLLREAVLSLKYRDIGYGGARGGGKSRGIRDLAIELSFRFRVPVLIFRRLRENLLKNHINPLLAEHPELRPYFNKSEFILYDPVTGEPRITFGYAERDEDIAKFQGSEYAVIFIDEATQATKHQIEFLSTCLRDSTGRFPRPKMVYTMNPGGVSHTYLKRLFIDKRYEENEDPNDYFFIQAKVYDNVFWVLPKLRSEGLAIEDYYSWDDDKKREYIMKYSDYAKTLAKLPEDMRKAHLDGDWDAIEGQFFDFRRPIHVITDKHYLSWDQIKTKYKLIGAMDYGNTTVVEILGKDEFGRVINFDELYQYKLPRQLKIQQLKDFLDYRGLTGLTILGDTNMWIKDGFDAAVTNSPAHEYIQAGIKLIPVSKHSPDGRPYRYACNDTIRDYLYFEYDNHGNLIKPPKLKIYERCSMLIETLPAVTTKLTDPNDFEGGDMDHAIDAFKYGLMWLVTPKASKAKKDIKPNGRGPNKEFKDVVERYRKMKRKNLGKYAYFRK